MTVISESGLYALVFKSSKPEAKRFRKWITSKVLPEMRKHVMPNAVNEAASVFDFVEAVSHGTLSNPAEKEAMMNLGRGSAGIVKKDHRIYSVKTSIATIEAPATAKGRNFILEMLDELHIR